MPGSDTCTCTHVRTAHSFTAPFACEVVGCSCEGFAVTRVEAPLVREPEPETPVQTSEPQEVRPPDSEEEIEKRENRDLRLLLHTFVESTWPQRIADESQGSLNWPVAEYNDYMRDLIDNDEWMVGFKLKLAKIEEGIEDERSD